MKTKSCKLVCVCFIAVSITFFALPGFAADSTLRIKCVDSSGSPAQNVKVAVISIPSQKAKDKKSDAQGIAEFTKLDNGVYRVVGRKDGFVPALFEFVMLKESKESVTLTLEAGADKKLYFEDPALDERSMVLMRQGLDNYKQSKFADAEKLISQALEINPSNAEMLYYYAISCLQQSKFDPAVAALQKAAKIADMLKILSELAPPGPQNAYEQVSQSAQTLLKKMPAIRGEDALKHQKYDEAIAHFSEAVKSDPGNSEFHANLAIALTNAKRFDEGIAAVDKAIQLKPGEKSYTSLKDNIKARRENAEILKAQAIMDEGKKLFQDGDAAGALKKFEEARNMVAQDKQSPLWTQIAKAQAKLNQPDAAVASFKKSIELAPPDKVPDYRNAFAQYYVDQKKYEEAIDVMADPKTAGSKSVEQILLELAQTSKDRDPQLAEAALERVIKTNPNNADVYFDLGRMYYADGKEKDSRTRELLTRYVEIGKDKEKIESAKDLLVSINRRSK